MSLPRAYWCHADYTAALTSVPAVVPDDLTALAPVQAVEWVRDQVRAVSWQLNREEFDHVWAWLGQHRHRDAAITALRRGGPYTYSLATSGGQWTWTTYPVSLLPVTGPCAELRLLTTALATAVKPPGLEPPHTTSSRRP